MGITFVESALLVVSVVVFIVSFFMPDSKKETRELDEAYAQEQIKEMVSKELSQVRGHVDEVTEETVKYALEKTEISLERISNEKIMALGEYSDTILQDIHKNHEEVVFLYDMLNTKQDSLKKTVSEAGKIAKTMQDSVASFQNLSVQIEKDRKLEPEVSKEEKAALTEMPKMVTPAFRQVSQSPRKITKEDLSVEIEPQTNGTVGQEPQQKSNEKSDNIAEIILTGDGDRNSNEKILELHRQGKSNVAIAKELGLGVGEVKLVIDLYKNI